MGNRILKESICVSESIDALDLFEEVFFYRLLVNCDDYGRMDARTAILKARLFPLKSVSDSQIENVLEHLQHLGMMEVYAVDGRPYLQLCNWGVHQRLRRSVPKFPAPVEATSDAEAAVLTAVDMPADILPQIAADCRLNPNTNTNPNTNPNPNKNPTPKECTERQAASVPQVAPAYLLPLNNGSNYAITPEQVAQWQALYPSVDIMQQLRNMHGWLDANKPKRKTIKGIERFIAGWLSREQDRGASPSSSASPSASQRSGYPAKTVIEQQYSQRIYDPAEFSALSPDQLEALAQLEAEEAKKNNTNGGTSP